MDIIAHINIGAPLNVFLNITAVSNNYNNDTTLQFELLLYNKTSTRLPESMMFSFMPKSSEKNGENNVYSMNKMGSEIKFTNIRLNGSQYQHGIWEDVYVDIKDSNTRMTVKSLDAGLMCPITNQNAANGWFGTPTSFPVPLRPLTDDQVTGFAFNLFNNLWSTNYVQWYPFMKYWPLIGDTSDDANIKYRFQLSIE